MEFLDVTVQILQGALNTVGLFFATLIIALPLGMAIALCSMSKFKLLSKITNIFIWIIRGTPLMLQVIIVQFIPGILFGFPMKIRFLSALVAFSINYAAYFAEIYRGGINSVSKGQYEAGYVLGMSRAQI
ncbi:MAG: ABC transporter permease subunit, partial [Clostridia bacterium]